ncbi:hypothetical protein HG537_0E00440 [Torulaspora globosa]|uniref:Helicase SWR1 n=1 Tax=Torulaspora globosa TaxID=48254 RepID=A0A7H9HTM7_9SACH|nr:hypothetical protein HG537_0E00440 [Torulaspora sp. CBS 2947]
MVKTTMSKAKKKSISSKKVERLAQLRFEYELLANELFHLKEFMSLVEFDPSYENESESYRRFLVDDGVSLGSVEESGDGNGRVRRRQLRASTTTTVNEEGNGVVWAEVEPVVKAKYAELKRALEGGHVKRDQVPMKRPRVPKLAARKGSKLPSPVSNGSSALSSSQKQGDHAGSEVGPDSLEDSFDDEVYYGQNIEEDYYFTTSSEEEPESRRQRQRKRPRINLVVHPPKQTVTNPLHVNKPQFTNLHEYINSFRSMDEDMSIEKYEHYIQEQKKVVTAIRKGLENGALRYDPDTDSVQPITTKEARLTQSHRPEPITYLYKEQNLQTFQDYLLNHGIFMSRLFQNNKKARIARARKVSFMIEQHFKHIAGAEERKAKEEEKHKRNLARAAMQAVKKRWTLAEKAYRVLLKDEEEHLKRIKGKEHLSKMLEQSTQLLEAQLTYKAGDGESSDRDSDNESNMEDSSNSENDDDLLTSSSEEEEINEEREIKSDSEPIEDEDLTEEQLKVKYANINEAVAIQDETQMDASDLSDDDLSVTTEESSEELSEEEQNGLVSDASNKNVGLSLLLEQGHGNDNDVDDSDESVEYKSEQSSEEDVKHENQENEVQMDEKSDLGLPNGEAEQKPDHTLVNARNTDSLNEEGKPEADPYSVEDVPVPQLLRGTLRTYQKQGLNWMASLYNNGTNGILADEMGLGKTIQTISLLAYLACEKHNWGPHLIVVPTSVLLNWEMELKRFAPGFKVLTYYGTPQQRKEKRRGWNKPDAFHICIVSYQLVVQDQNSFKRKRWEYMILDEAHNIKNFRSTRWQALLNFNTQRRLLLTGTPLQNNIAELWSLLYFLMPQTVTAGQEVTGFADLDAFQQWFGKPVDKLIETGQNYQHDAETKKTVTKLHQVLRPYLLRRLKVDVEKQMPAKHEHIVYCRLSKRQRFLYDDFMSRAQTKATLASGNFMSIVNCLMQLRKVCNHPDLFEVRPILTSFCSESSVIQNYVSTNQFVHDLANREEYKTRIGLDTMNLVFTGNDLESTTHTSQATSKLQCVAEFVKQIDELRQQEMSSDSNELDEIPQNFQNATEFFKRLGMKRLQETIEGVESVRHINKLRCDRKPMYGKNVFKLLTIERDRSNDTHTLRLCTQPLQNKFDIYKDIIEKYAVITPNVVTLDTRYLTLGLNNESPLDENTRNLIMSNFQKMENPLHHLQTKLTIAFPDKSLLQYDCGKLQKLAELLQSLKDNGHRALIFTQMTKVLDILEQFLNYHGYLYMRLDGATKIEDRQILTERFNSDPRITVFILSSRSGGLGINLTGADTVIFYDSDWNPAMDKQCQDRCHRIGQTRDVHIYRFVSEHTIESNILKKANQKRHLDNVVIQEGDFTTDYFTKLSVKDLLGSEVTGGLKVDDKPLLQEDSQPTKDPRSLEKLLAQAEDEDDVMAANLAMKEVEVDNNDFTDQNPSNEQQASAAEATPEPYDEYEGTNHVEEYMLRFIANGYYY